MWEHLDDALRHALDTVRSGRPVGTGPYRCTDFRPGDMVRGELNPAYHLPNRPHFDALEIKGGGDAVSAARAVLQSGDYDFGWNIQVEDEVLARIERGGARAHGLRPRRRRGVPDAEPRGPLEGGRRRAFAPVVTASLPD
jgi:ABC-type transport system substrate-binding protein